MCQRQPDTRTESGPHSLLLSDPCLPETAVRGIVAVDLFGWRTTGCGATKPKLWDGAGNLTSAQQQQFLDLLNADAKVAQMQLFPATRAELTTQNKGTLRKYLSMCYRSHMQLRAIVMRDCTVLGPYFTC